MTQFNLEWAKHGGVVTDDEHVWMWRCVDTSPLGINDELIVYLAGINTQTSNITSTVSSNLRMATSEECELAGIEYIDPPVSAEELAELRKDKERLDYLINQRGDDAEFNDRTSHNGWMVRLGDSGNWFETEREAIDAAMKGGA